MKKPLGLNVPTPASETSAPRHCAVENPCAEGGAGDVVECDYCGRAFALADGGGADEFLMR